MQPARRLLSLFYNLDSSVNSKGHNALDSAMLSVFVNDLGDTGKELNCGKESTECVSVTSVEMGSLSHHQHTRSWLAGWRGA